MSEEAARGGFERITVRRDVAADGRELRRLAAVDSKPLPADDYLVAEAGGRLLAAVGVGTAAAIADPFRPTADIVSLLEVRAARIRRTNGTRSAPTAGMATGRVAVVPGPRAECSAADCG